MGHPPCWIQVQEGNLSVLLLLSAPHHSYLSDLSDLGDHPISHHSLPRSPVRLCPSLSVLHFRRRMKETRLAASGCYPLDNCETLTAAHKRLRPYPPILQSQPALLPQETLRCTQPPQQCSTFFALSELPSLLSSPSIPRKLLLPPKRPATLSPPPAFPPRRPCPTLFSLRDHDALRTAPAEQGRRRTLPHVRHRRWASTSSSAASLPDQQTSPQFTITIQSIVIFSSEPPSVS